VRAAGLHCTRNSLDLILAQVAAAVRCGLRSYSPDYFVVRPRGTIVRWRHDRVDIELHNGAELSIEAEMQLLAAVQTQRVHCLDPQRVAHCRGAEFVMGTV